MALDVIADIVLNPLFRKADIETERHVILQEIGQAVGLSPSPCWGRIKKMEEAGVIEGYTVRLNPQALDWADTVLDLPEGLWLNVLTGDEMPGGEVRLAEILARFPVGLLEKKG